MSNPTAFTVCINCGGALKWFEGGWVHTSDENPCPFPANTEKPDDER